MTPRKPRLLRRAGTALLAIGLSHAGFVQASDGTLISTEAVARVAAPQVAARDAQAARAHALVTLERADLAAALAERGVSADEARARIAALTDDEAVRFAQEIDAAPAGGNDILGTLVFIFVLLLITDILGFTKVFPFTRAIR
jgi:hypothetical protein